MRSTFKVLFYLKRNKDKNQKVVPVMGRITVNGSMAFIRELIASCHTGLMNEL